MWLDISTFASIVGISERKARSAASRIHNGTSPLWRDHPLITSVSVGRGGKSGVRYLVWADSIPPAFQERLKALQSAGEITLRPAGTDDSFRERAWKLALLQPILDTAKGSPDRAAAIAAVAGKPRPDWRGDTITPARSVIYRWLAAYEDGGTIHALERTKRKDKGVRRVHISQAWDAAVPFSDAAKAEIAGDLVQHIRGLSKDGARFKIVSNLGASYLRKVTLAHGFPKHDDAVLDDICAIPRKLIDAQDDARKVHRHKFDRKASEDDRPRAKRTIEGLQPMQVVVMDVHHLNVLVRRKDGSTATPKLLAFHDVATHRVWCELVFFEKAGGVRNADVISAFLAMAEHEAFGLPDTIYCDNGSEYRFADALDDALKLKVRIKPLEELKRSSQVIRAKPYNAAAKIVEQFFRHGNQTYFRHIPGWIDDDRMNPKRQEIGKALPAFEAGFDALVTTFFGLMRAYEVMPQKGALGGQSPATAFGGFVREGWRATTIDRRNLGIVFTTPVQRRVRKHAIEIDGRTWIGDALDRYLGNHVTVRLPKWHSFNELRIEDGSGRFLGIIQPQVATGYLDARGAQSTAGRVKARNASIRETDRSIPNVSVLGELIETGKEKPRVQPNEPIATVTVSDRSEVAEFEPAGHSRLDTMSERERRVMERQRNQALILGNKP